MLKRAFELMSGYPRALEALAATLKADSSAQLEDVLNELAERIKKMDVIKEDEHADVVWAMVGQAFNRLDETARQVMQALAIFQQPVASGAVDFLLQPFNADIDSAPILRRLVNADFVRSEAGRYYLHPVDHDYALSLLPAEGETFSCKALYRHAADYFRTTQKPRDAWKNISDLQPHIAEYHMRLQAKDYDSAARVFSDVSEPLDLWGYYREIIEICQPLQNKINDNWLTMKVLNELGWAHNIVGNIPNAILAYEEGLTAAQKAEEKQAQGAFLGNLGNAYSNLGEVRIAINYYEQALEIQREIGDKRGQGSQLGNLGLAYSDLGEVRIAINYYEQALQIAREIGEKSMEGSVLGNLGNHYNGLGQYDKAVEYYEQSLKIHREIGDRQGESIQTINVGLVYVAQGKIAEAIKLYQQAIQIGDEILFSGIQNYARWSLALAYLLQNDLDLAWTAIEEATQYDVPTNNGAVQALRVVLALRQGNQSTAEESFRTANTHCDTLLSHSDQQYGHWDTKGLALAGLALVTEDIAHVDASVVAYQKARSIMDGAGHVAHELRVLDALLVADTAGLLGARVRQSAGGE